MDKNEETGASTPGRGQFLGVAGAAANAVDNVTTIEVDGSQPKAVAAFIASAVQGGATR